MPQLDKLIVLTQYKVFLVVFLMVYFLLLFIVLPKLNLTLRLRKAKLRNLFFLTNEFRALRLFTFLKPKEILLNYFSLIEQEILSRISFNYKEKLSIIILRTRSFFTNLL